MTDFLIDTDRGMFGGSITGSGPCVALVAGLGATRRLWGELPQILSRRFTVLTIDNPGVGESRGAGPFSADTSADALVAAADHHGCNTFSILGASLGGLIALRTAIRHPDKVDRLVVISAAARLTCHGRRSISLLRDLLLHLPPAAFGRSMMSLAFAPPFQNRLPGFVDQSADLYGLNPRDVPGALAQAEHMLKGWDDRSALQTLNHSALVLAGLRDPIVAAEDTAEIAQAMPQAELVTVPDGGHSVLAEGGRSVFDRVIAFLGESD